MKVLVVDDKRSARRVLRHILEGIEGLDVVEADSVDSAKRVLESAGADLALVDIRLSDEPTDRGGLDLLHWMKQSVLAVPAVMVTASTELAEIREAMRGGAQDYVLKDELSPEMLVPVVEGLLERQSLRGQVTELRKRLDSEWGISAIIGSSPELDRVRQLVARVAPADAPVLIRGETGSGKEMVARAIHETGPRRDHPFVAVNCSALPGTLIESMIFGHERGAFTGAQRRVRGQLELAGSGTVLLDEIAEMPTELQAKLLRVLEDRRFRPLGAEIEVPLRARVLAATHVDLESRIARGTFREDLFFRLNVVTIELPPLRERPDDIPELVRSFLGRQPRKMRFDEAAVEWLGRRGWPGNIRELRNVIDRLALLSESDEIDVACLEQIVGTHSAGNPILELDKLARNILALPERMGSKLDAVERAVLHHAIETCGGNKSAAARLIGVDRKALLRKWDRLSDAPEESEEGEN